MVLEAEYKTYRRKLAELLMHRGKYVVIRGTRVLGVYGDYEDALGAGYEAFGLRRFLVQRIEDVEIPLRFTRGLGQCPT